MGRKLIIDFIKGGIHTVLGAGMFLITDLLRNGSINYPLTDLAAGSGVAGGYNIANRKKGGIIASFLAFLGPLSPYLVEYLKTGDLGYFGMKLVGKCFEFSLGAFLGYGIGEILKTDKEE